MPKVKRKFKIGEIVAVRGGKLGWVRIANCRWNRKMGFSAPCWEYDIRHTVEGEIDPGWQESVLRHLTKREKGGSNHAE